MGVDEHESVNILIKRSDINLISTNEQRTTALILAATNQTTELVSQLVSKTQCLDVNISDVAGDTALICAVRCNNWEIVRLIVTHTNVHLDHRNKAGSICFCILPLFLYILTIISPQYACPCSLNAQMCHTWAVNVTEMDLSELRQWSLSYHFPHQKVFWMIWFVAALFCKFYGTFCINEV